MGVDDIGLFEEEAPMRMAVPTEPSELKRPQDDIGLFVEEFFPKKEPMGLLSPEEIRRQKLIKEMMLTPEELEVPGAMDWIKGIEEPSMDAVSYELADILADVSVGLLTGGPAGGTYGASRGAIKALFKASSKEAAKDALVALSRNVGREVTYGIVAGGSMTFVDLIGGGPIISLMSGIVGPTATGQMLTMTRRGLVQYLKTLGKEDPDKLRRIVDAAESFPESGIAKKLKEASKNIEVVAKDIGEIEKRLGIEFKPERPRKVVKAPKEAPYVPISDIEGHELFVEKGLALERKKLLDEKKIDNLETAAQKDLYDALAWYHGDESVDIDVVHKRLLGKASGSDELRNLHGGSKEDFHIFTNRTRKAAEFVEALKAKKIGIEEPGAPGRALDIAPYAGMYGAFGVKTEWHSELSRMAERYRTEENINPRVCWDHVAGTIRKRKNPDDIIVFLDNVTKRELREKTPISGTWPRNDHCILLNKDGKVVDDIYGNSLTSGEYEPTHHVKAGDFMARVEGRTPVEPLKPPPPSGPKGIAPGEARMESERSTLRELKSTFEKLGEGISLTYKWRGHPETGLHIKGTYSTWERYREEGITLIRDLSKLKMSPEEFGEVALLAERPSLLKKPGNERYEEAVKIVRKYFDDSFREFKALGGLKYKFPQTYIARLRRENIHLSKQVTDHPNSPMVGIWKTKLDDNRRTMRKLEKMKFVHIPTRMWFDNIAQQDPKRFREILRILVQKRRKTPLISDLVDWKIITKEEADIRDIIANYADRKGRDIALLRTFKAARKEGLVTSSERVAEKKGFVRVHPTKFPMFRGEYVHPQFQDWLYEYTHGLGKGMSMPERFFSTIKGFQFHNPFFLGMYDIIQSAMMSQFRALRPKYLKKGLMSAIKKDDDYWEALDNYIASKPFRSPFENYQQMVENAKNPWTKRAMRILNPGRAIRHPIVEAKDIYSLSWNTAWWLDKAIRNVSYQYLLGQGFAPREAAQISALYHSDYADVPPKLRRLLNKIFFTPTFKLTMGKAYIEMVDGAARAATMNGLIRGKMTPRQIVAARSLATMLAINQGFDMYMQSQGFGRDQWGRRYTKVVDTDEGDRELVITFSHPANLPFKYVYRLMDALKPGGDSSWWRFLRANKYEVHPVYRILVWDMAENRKSDGTQIYSEGDDLHIKILKSLSYSAKQTIRWAEVFEPGAGEKDVREVMYKDFGKILTWALKPFTFSYLRKTIGERGAARTYKIREQIRRDIKEGIFTDDVMENYRRQLDEIIREIEEGG